MMKLNTMNSAILALSILAGGLSGIQAKATTVGNGEASCGGATKRLTCELCVGTQKSDAEEAAMKDWDTKCEAFCTAKNKWPQRCYKPAAKAKRPTASCVAVGSPPTDEKWMATISKQCSCVTTEC